MPELQRVAARQVHSLSSRRKCREGVRSLFTIEHGISSQSPGVKEPSIIDVWHYRQGTSSKVL
jgi:hypothetical protein